MAIIRHRQRAITSAYPAKGQGRWINPSKAGGSGPRSIDGLQLWITGGAESQGQYQASRFTDKSGLGRGTTTQPTYYASSPYAGVMAPNAKPPGLLGDPTGANAQWNRGVSFVDAATDWSNALPLGGFTFAFLYRHDSAGDDQGRNSYIINSGPLTWFAQARADVIRIDIKGASVGRLDCSEVMVSGEYYRVIVTFLDDDGQRPKALIGRTGEPSEDQGTTGFNYANPLTQAGTDLVFGGSGVSWPGTFYDILIYDNILSADDITKLDDYLAGIQDSLPALETIQSITNAAGTAEATMVDHGLVVGQTTSISGATGADGAFYNGTKRVLSTADADTFTYDATGVSVAAAVPGPLILDRIGPSWANMKAYGPFPDGGGNEVSFQAWRTGAADAGVIVCMPGSGYQINNFLGYVAVDEFASIIQIQQELGSPLRGVDIVVCSADIVLAWSDLNILQVVNDFIKGEGAFTVTGYIPDNPNVNPDRLYLAGSSNGATGVYNIMRNHGGYAAGIPMSQAVTYMAGDELMPQRGFVGFRDDIRVTGMTTYFDLLVANGQAGALLHIDSTLYSAAPPPDPNAEHAWFPQFWADNWARSNLWPWLAGQTL